MRFTATAAVLLALGALACAGCGELVPKDVSSLLVPRLHRSEIVGFLAGFGTTFAAVPDLVAMFRRRSTAGMNPTMASIMGLFQILWVYYGLLIASRPVIAWNIIGVLINLSTVAAYRHFSVKRSAERRVAG
jgi:uncharacterized protein with PQ loop repeat